MAIIQGNTDILKAVVDHRADVNAGNEYVGTPLRLAVCRGYLEAVRILLNHHADASCADYHGKSVLMEAAERRYVQIVQELLDRKADVNKVSEDEYCHVSTALEITVCKCHSPLKV